MRAAKSTRERVEAGLPRRRRKERIFKLVGLLATTVGIVFLGDNLFFIRLSLLRYQGRYSERCPLDSVE